jgi:hypothetical protein
MGLLAEARGAAQKGASGGVFREGRYFGSFCSIYMMICFGL